VQQHDSFEPIKAQKQVRRLKLRGTVLLLLFW